ncbi:MAG: hypothetical protein ACRDNJ_12370 [Solirubrobacteraceae bacterium]
MRISRISSGSAVLAASDRRLIIDPAAANAVLYSAKPSTSQSAPARTTSPAAPWIACDPTASAQITNATPIATSCANATSAKPITLPSAITSPYARLRSSSSNIGA